MIVLDASAAVEWLLRTPTGSRVAHRILAREEEMHAPHLLKLEVAQVLRRADIVRLMEPSRAQELLEDLLNLRLVQYDHEPLLRRVWELRHNLTAYDASYVALAEELGAPLLTCDAKIATAPGHRAHVELV